MKEPDPTSIEQEKELLDLLKDFRECESMDPDGSVRTEILLDFHIKRIRMRIKKNDMPTN